MIHNIPNSEHSKAGLDITQNIQTAIPDVLFISHLIEQNNLPKIGSGVYYNVYDIPNSQFVIKIPNINYGSLANLRPEEVDVKVRHEHEIVASYMEDHMPLTRFCKLSIGEEKKQVVVQKKVSGVELGEFERDPNTKPSIQLQTEFRKFATAYKLLTLRGYIIESNQLMINIPDNKIFVYDTNALVSFDDMLLAVRPFLEMLNIMYEGSDIDQLWNNVVKKLPELDPVEVKDEKSFIFNLQSYTDLYKRVLVRLEKEYPKNINLPEGLKKLFSLLSKFTPSNFDLNIQTAVLAVKLNL